VDAAAIEKSDHFAFFIWSCEVPMPPDKTTPKTSSDKNSIGREDHKKVQQSIASMNDKRGR
jgi:hypothetical protein